MMKNYQTLDEFKEMALQRWPHIVNEDTFLVIELAWEKGANEALREFQEEFNK